MHKSKKMVTLITASPMRTYYDYSTTWADVWVRLDVRRKRVPLGPTLCGLSDLKSEIELEKEGIEAEKQWGSVESLSLLRGYLASLEAGALFVVDPDTNNACDTIYVREEEVDRRLVERVLEGYLRWRGFLKGPVCFRWQNPWGRRKYGKRKPIYVHSM